jgi:glutamine cyclotransferase
MVTPAHDALVLVVAPVAAADTEAPVTEVAEEVKEDVNPYTQGITSRDYVSLKYKQ